MNVELLVEYVLSPAIVTSATLGFMVGALYGFPIVGESRLVFPYTLWTVGLAFIVSLGILAAGGNGQAPVSLESSAARGILWTVLCAAIPIGRGARIRVERWRIRRRTRKLEE